MAVAALCRSTMMIPSVDPQPLARPEPLYPSLQETVIHAVRRSMMPRLPGRRPPASRPGGRRAATRVDRCQAFRYKRESAVRFLFRRREAVLLAPMWFTAYGKDDCSGHLPRSEALAVLWGWLMRVLQIRANGFVAY